MSTNKPKRQKAFTLVELLVAMLISGILIGLTSTVYIMFRKSMALDQSKADLSQNARIVFDRLSREIRQTPYVVTDLPNDPADTSVDEPYEIEFQDGHSQVGDSNYLTYRRYFVNNGVLQMQLKEYYFASNPSVRVHQNDIGTGGVAPVANVISIQDIAENVQSIAFYGGSNILMIMTTADGNGQSYVLRTTVFGRNI